MQFQDDVPVPGDIFSGQRILSGVWISVKERLPSDSHVLGHVVDGGLLFDCDDSMIDIVCYFPRTGEWTQYVEGEDEPVTVSHWTPLPDKPEGWCDRSSEEGRAV